MTDAILDENGAPYFLLLHQARNSDGVPDEVKQLLAQYPMQAYIDLLLPIFEQGQQTGEILAGDPAELISAYLTILSGVMALGEGYTLPSASLIMRVIAGS